MGFGWGGQYLVVVPACRLVVAHLVDTGASDLARLGWLIFGNPVEPTEFASILRPIFLRVGCGEVTEIESEAPLAGSVDSMATRFP
jgi:hypothetical protein